MSPPDPQAVGGALAELRNLVTCRCEPEYTDRGRHHPTYGDACYYAEEVEILAKALGYPVAQGRVRPPRQVR